MANNPIASPAPPTWADTPLAESPLVILGAASRWPPLAPSHRSRRARPPLGAPDHYAWSPAAHIVAHPPTMALMPLPATHHRSPANTRAFAVPCANNPAPPLA